MKMIVAVIKPSRLDAVLEAVTEAGASGLTVTEVRGYGRQRGHKEIYRGLEYNIFFLPKIEIEIVVEDKMVDDTVKTILDNARTGHIGDGKIFVMDVINTIRIRTGEQGEDAL